MSNDALNVTLSGKDESRDVAEGLRDLERLVGSFGKQVTEALKAIEGESAKVPKHLQHVRDEVEKTNSKLGDLEHALEDAFSPTEMVGELGRTIAGIVAPLALVEAGLDAVKEGIHEVAELSFEGIRKADEIRDLDAALTRIVGSSTRAAETMEFFERAESRTRSQADDLARAYDRVADIAARKGFDKSFLRGFIVELDQSSVALGRSSDEILDAFEQLLTGRISGRSPLLAGLGITKADIESGKVGLQDIVDKIHELARTGEEMGHSFDSTMGKVKDTIVTKIAEGFNEARGSATKGMAGVIEAVNDPHLQEGLREFGLLLAHIVERTGDLARNWRAVVATIGDLKGSLSAGLGSIIGGPAVASLGGWRGSITSALAGPYAPALLGWAQYRSGDLYDQNRAAIANSDATELALRRDTLGRAALADSGLANRYFDLRGFNGANAYDTLVRQIGSAKQELDPAQFERFMAGVAKAIGDATLTWAEFKKAKDEALKSPSEENGKNHFGPLTGNSEERARAAREQVDALTLSIEHQIGAIDRQTRSASTLDPLQKAQIAMLGAVADAEERAASATLQLDKAAAILGEQGVAKAKRALDSMRSAAEQLAWVNYQRASAGIFNDLAKNAPGAVDEAAAQRKADAYDELSRQMAAAEMQGEFLDRLNQRAIEKWRTATEEFSRTLAGALADGARSGGKDFGEIAARNFSNLVEKGFAKIVTDVLGKPGDASIGQDPTRLYDSAGRMLSPAAARRAQVAEKVYDYGSIGFGAYDAAAQADGTRTASVVQGAAAGAVFSVPGAIIGAIAGLIGGILGEQARQQDYKYAIPYVTSRGDAGLGLLQNIAPGEAERMVAQIQDKFDTLWNAWIRILVKAPDAIIPAIERIDGKFQENASSKFLKHYDEWLNGRFGDDIAAVVKDPLEKVYVALGLTGEKFHELWRKFDKLDPTKTVALWGQLFDALQNIQDASKFFGAENGFGRNTSWQTAMIAADRENSRSYAQIMREDFDHILDAAKHIGDFTGEAQIEALAEVGRMMVDAREKEKAMVKEIIALQERAHDMAEGARERYTLMGIRKSDGSVDAEGQAKWLRDAVDRDLGKILGATNARDIDKAFTDVLRIVDQIVSLGYQISPQTGEDWRKWALSVINIAEGDVNTRTAALGQQVSSEADAFMQQFKPYFDRFATVTSDVSDDLGGVGGAAGGAGDRFNRVGDDAATLADKFELLGGKIDGVISLIDKHLAGGGAVAGPKGASEIAGGRVLEFRPKVAVTIGDAAPRSTTRSKDELLAIAAPLHELADGAYGAAAGLRELHDGILVVQSAMVDLARRMNQMQFAGGDAQRFVLNTQLARMTA